MLFMDIWTWESEKSDEMAKRGAAWKCPEGMKELGYWYTSREIVSSIFMR